MAGEDRFTCITAQFLMNYFFNKNSIQLLEDSMSVTIVENAHLMKTKLRNQDWSVNEVRMNKIGFIK